MAPKTKGAPPLRDRTCSNCAHYRPEPESPDVGECREGPPTVLYDTEEGAFSVYPMVAGVEDWCGRHRGCQ